MKKYAINSPQVISEVASGEAVIINLETGSYYNLGVEAAKIWLPLMDGVAIDALKSKIEPQTQCSKADAENKIDVFIAQLLAEGLIKETEQSAAQLPENISVDVERLELETYTDMQDLLGLDPIHEVSAEAGWPVQAEHA